MVLAAIDFSRHGSQLNFRGLGAGAVDSSRLGGWGWLFDAWGRLVFRGFGAGAVDFSMLGGWGG